MYHDSLPQSLGDRQTHQNKTGKLYHNFDRQTRQARNITTLLQDIDQGLPGVSHFKYTLPISPFAHLSPLQYLMWTRHMRITVFLQRDAWVRGSMHVGIKIACQRNPKSFKIPDKHWIWDFLQDFEIFWSQIVIYITVYIMHTPNKIGILYQLSCE
jgi:hypothetical protein